MIASFHKLNVMYFFSGKENDWLLTRQALVFFDTLIVAVFHILVFSTDVSISSTTWLYLFVYRYSITLNFNLFEPQSFCNSPLSPNDPRVKLKKYKPNTAVYIKYLLATPPITVHETSVGHEPKLKQVFYHKHDISWKFQNKNVGRLIFGKWIFALASISKARMSKTDFL